MKRKLFLIAFTWVSVLSLTAQHKLTISIDGIDNVKGNMMVALFDSKENFLRERLAGKMVEIKEQEIKVEFDNLKEGDYAISLYQDENKDGKLNTGIFGIPTEKYGFSNNAKPKMGPPAYNDCVFKLNADKLINITLK